MTEAPTIDERAAETGQIRAFRAEVNLCLRSAERCNNESWKEDEKFWKDRAKTLKSHIRDLGADA